MDEQTGFNPKRRLCSDGTCTGIIGRDGRCGECGRSGETLADDDAASELAPPTAPLFTSTDRIEVTGDAPTGAEGFDPSRRLCDDGTCVGVIGAGGVCTVCGRRGA